MTAREHAWLYNLDNGRNPDTVNAEVRAILGTGPLILGMVEAVGYRLLARPGYTLLRDTSRPSRANVAAYVSNKYDAADVDWTDLDEQWTRTKYPEQGVHPPRSVLSFRLGGRQGMQGIVGHQCPKGTDNTPAAQQEGVDAITALMSPWSRDRWDHRTKARQQLEQDRARLALVDWNRRKWEPGPGPATVARRVDGKAHGMRIDAAVERELEEVQVSYPTRVGQVRLLSDHGHALRVEFARPEGLTR